MSKENEKQLNELFETVNSEFETIANILLKIREGEEEIIARQKANF